MEGGETMKNVDKSELKNSPLARVKLQLSCGRVVDGFVSPPFWVREGYGKINYPKLAENYLPVISEEGIDSYAQFQDGKMLFDEVPSGYEEIALEFISHVEVYE